MTTLKLPFPRRSKQEGKDARSVANVLLTTARARHNTLTPLQLLKIVYFCQGWSLALLNTPLFRQDIEAWQFGPVVRDVYNEIRRYIDQPVLTNLKTNGDALTEKDKELITSVLKQYEVYTGPQLIRLTHLPRSPWTTTWRNRKTNHDVIPIQDIKEYFLQLKQEYYRGNPRPSTD